MSLSLCSPALSFLARANLSDAVALGEEEVPVQAASYQLAFSGDDFFGSSLDICLNVPIILFGWLAEGSDGTGYKERLWG